MAISRKRCKIGGKLVLITNRKSYMSFRLVPKSVTLNGVMTLYCVISTNLGSFRAHCVKVHVRYLISWWVLVYSTYTLDFWILLVVIGCWSWGDNMKGAVSLPLGITGWRKHELNSLWRESGHTEVLHQPALRLESSRCTGVSVVHVHVTVKEALIVFYYELLTFKVLWYDTC